MIAVKGNVVGGLQYTRQVSPLASSRSKMVSAVLCTGHESPGSVLTTNPDAVPALKNERWVKVWEGTLQNQWLKVAKPRASVANTGSCSGV